MNRRQNIFLLSSLLIFSVSYAVYNIIHDANSYRTPLSVLDNRLRSLKLPDSSTQVAALEGAGSGLVGWWKFDEGSGTTTGDSSGNGNAGVFSGTPVWVDGHNGKALSFTASSSITIPHKDNLNITNGLTLSFWVNAKSYTGGYADHLITKWSDTTDANLALYYFGQASTDPSPGHVQLWANSGGTWKRDSDPAQLSLNQWVHVAVSYGSTTGGQMYIDGQPRGYSNGGGLLANNQKPLVIGGFNGSIDDIRIYSRALNASEISGLSGSTASSTASAGQNVPATTTASASNATNTATSTNQNSIITASSTSNTTSNNNSSSNNSVTSNNTASNNSTSSNSSVANSSNTAVNLALNKTYTLSPAPSYALCTDIDDSSQLTDGKYVSGYFWVQPGTVGWQNIPTVTITIDLGKSQPIAGLSYNTAAGVAGVAFPAAIYVFVSDDGSNWHWAVDMVEQTYNSNPMPIANQYSLYRYKVNNLQTHGRYLKLVTVLNGHYTFVDEIEVYKGDDLLLNIPYAANSQVVPVDFINQKKLETKLHIRLRSDINDISNAIAASSLSSSEKNTFKAELDSLGKEISSVKISSPDNFSTVFPINDLHKRIFAVQASFWRSRGLNTVTVWPAFRWDMLTPTTVPRSEAVNLDMSMMNNEYRAQTFNVSNAGTTDVDVRFSIEGLPGGIDPSYISVHEAIFTDTTGNVPVAAALPVLAKQGDQYIVHVPSGLTKQIWLSFHTVNVVGGNYQGQIRLEGAGSNISTVPLRLKIYSLRFPDNPSLHLGGWDYTNGNGQYSITPQNRAAFIQQLREHYVDTPWATNSVMPSGRYDANGHMTQAPDPTVFKDWIGQWLAAKNYFIFSNVQEKFAGFSMDTPAFTQAVTEWTNWWAAQFKSSGIQLKQIGLLLRDEPHDATNDYIIIQYAKIIRATQPEINVFEDIAWDDPNQAAPDTVNLSQILSPHLPSWLYYSKSFGDFYLSQRDKGHELWFYSAAGPSRLLDPYTYYLTSAWFSWKYGAKGEEFWAFGDNSGTWGYNEYTSESIYSQMFISKTDIVAGKQMEAIREGVEDYEYLNILNNRIRSLESGGVSSPILAAARTLLNGAADRVTADRAKMRSDTWVTAKDRTVSERVRLEILEALVSLDSLGGQTNAMTSVTSTNSISSYGSSYSGSNAITSGGSSGSQSSNSRPANSSTGSGSVNSSGGGSSYGSLNSYNNSLNSSLTTFSNKVNSGGSTLKKVAIVKPTTSDNSLHSNSKTFDSSTTSANEIDISLPSVPTWVEVLRNMFLEIIGRIKAGAEKTVQSFGNVTK